MGGRGRPLLAACAAFLIGVFLGGPFWTAVLPLALLAVPRLRFAALGLSLGLLRGALSPAPQPFELPDEFEARVVAPGIVETPRGRVALHVVGDVHRGDVAVFVGHAHVPPPRLNPGGRDRRAELAARGIALEGSAEVVRVVRRGPALWRWLDGARARFAARAALLLSPERAALVTALAVGDRSGLSAAVEDDLARSGLVHLLASSGLHLAVAVLLVRELARRLWLRTRWAASVRASFVGAACALPFAVAEVLLLGAPWPAVRAGAGAAFGLCAAALSRKRDAMTTLFAAAAGCALLDPAAAHDLALQLSVVGIAGLLLVAPALRDLVPLRWPAPGAPWWRRSGEFVLMLACASAAAALCTAPLVAASFHRISLISVAANAFGLLPGLAAIPVCTLLVPFDWLPLWWLADVLSGATLNAAHFFASAPFAVLQLAAPGLLACALWYGGVVLIVRRLYRRALLPWAALAVLAFAHFPPARLRITFLAVGQGDSAIVQFPGGGAMLVDAGGDLRWPGRFDPGARDIVPALAELGISRLDLVVLTHPHPDHAGGLLTVLDRIPVRELWMTPEQDAIATAVRARAAERGVPVREPHAMQFGEVRIEVPSRFEQGRSLNDNSIVLRLVYRDVAALLAGDIEALAETDLSGPLQAQLLKAPHHGSRTSSTEAFLRKVSPQFTVYSCGAANRFGFPNADVMARTPGQHFSTAEGAVIAESDGHSLEVRRF